MLTVLAPAKINLTLEVLGKRADGYHEIRSVIQVINLCDTIHFQLGRNIEFGCDMPGWVAEESLVSKAAHLLQETTGCIKGATTIIEKRIQREDLHCSPKTDTKNRGNLGEKVM